MAKVVMIKGGCKCTGCLKEYPLELPMEVSELTEIIDRLVKKHEKCKEQLSLFYEQENELLFLKRLFSTLHNPTLAESMVLKRIQLLKYN